MSALETNTSKFMAFFMYSFTVYLVSSFEHQSLIFFAISGPIICFFISTLAKYVEPDSELGKFLIFILFVGGIAIPVMVGHKEGGDAGIANGLTLLTSTIGTAFLPLRK